MVGAASADGSDQTELLRAVGAVIASMFGALSTIVYPDNIGMLRTTRIGSRYAMLSAGILVILLGPAWGSTCCWSWRSLR